MQDGCTHSPSLKIYSRDQHSISRSMIDEDALRILYRLIRHGFKAYLVGGGVRDLLLNKQPKDYDIATDATPRKVKQLFNNSRIIGRRFRLVHIFFKDGKIIQVSTFRDISEESEAAAGDSTHTPGVPLSDNKYGTEETDAQRRDLTINGLFYDLATFSIIDYVGGMDDLRQGVIKVIGDPSQRFIEDPVRMLRVVRHAARAGFKIDKSCLKAIIEKRDLLANCSEMRVYEEVKKDLLSGASYSILCGLLKTELLPLLIPELPERLLKPESDCTQALYQIDSFILAGGEIGAVIPLAIIGLISIIPSGKLEDLSTEFKDSSELMDLVDGCFKNLAVPRKERLKICKLLVTLTHLWQTGEVKYSPARSSGRKRVGAARDDDWFSELLMLLTVLGFDSRAQELHAELAQSGPQKRSSSKSQHQEGKGREAKPNQRAKRYGTIRQGQ